MGIERFEEIEAWQAARGLTQRIYKATTQGQFTRGYGLCDQVQRSSISVRGFDSNSDEEFIRFLRHGLRSATEVQSHLYVALDQEYIDKEAVDLLYNQASKVKSLVSGFIRYLRS